MRNTKRLTVMAIESSCDDTSVAIICDDEKIERRIRANVVIGQSIHSEYNGVVPEKAARSHFANIDRAMRLAMDESCIDIREIDCIAATRGPGLIGGLLVGCVFAKTLCALSKKPFFGANHLEGHILSPRLCYDIDFPYIVLLVSGGNSMYVRVDGVGRYCVLGQTIDDALGEAFDKVAIMLGLSYPGGPIIDKMSKFGDPHRFRFTIPLQRRGGCDLSFSGIKTAVKRHIEILVQKYGELCETDKYDMAASFQHHVINFVMRQMHKVCIENSDVRNIVICGGVAANSGLRNAMAEYAHSRGINFYAPKKELCTDNAAMIGWSCIENINTGKEYHDIETKCNPRLNI